MICKSVFILLLNGAPLTLIQSEAIPSIQKTCLTRYNKCVKLIEVKEDNHLNVICGDN